MSYLLVMYLNVTSYKYKRKFVWLNSHVGMSTNNIVAIIKKFSILRVGAKLISPPPSNKKGLGTPLINNKLLVYNLIFHI